MYNACDFNLRANQKSESPLFCTPPPEKVFVDLDGVSGDKEDVEDWSTALIMRDFPVKIAELRHSWLSEDQSKVFMGTPGDHPSRPSNNLFRKVPRQNSEHSGKGERVKQCQTTRATGGPLTSVTDPLSQALPSTSGSSVAVRIPQSHLNAPSLGNLTGHLTSEEAESRAQTIMQSRRIKATRESYATHGFLSAEYVNVCSDSSLDTGTSYPRDISKRSTAVAKASTTSTPQVKVTSSITGDVKTNSTLTDSSKQASKLLVRTTAHPVITLSKMTASPTGSVMSQRAGGSTKRKRPLPSQTSTPVTKRVKKHGAFVLSDDEDDNNCDTGESDSDGSGASVVCSPRPSVEPIAAERPHLASCTPHIPTKSLNRARLYTLLSRRRGASSCPTQTPRSVHARTQILRPFPVAISRQGNLSSHAGSKLAAGDGSRHLPPGNGKSTQQSRTAITSKYKSNPSADINIPLQTKAKFAEDSTVSDSSTNEPSENDNQDCYIDHSNQSPLRRTASKIQAKGMPKSPSIKPNPKSTHEENGKVMYGLRVAQSKAQLVGATMSKPGRTGGVMTSTRRKTESPTGAGSIDGVSLRRASSGQSTAEQLLSIARTTSMVASKASVSVPNLSGERITTTSQFGPEDCSPQVATQVARTDAVAAPTLILSTPSYRQRNGDDIAANSKPNKRNIALASVVLGIVAPIKGLSSKQQATPSSLAGGRQQAPMSKASNRTMVPKAADTSSVGQPSTDAYATHPAKKSAVISKGRSEVGQKGMAINISSAKQPPLTTAEPSVSLKETSLELPGSSRQTLIPTEGLLSHDNSSSVQTILPMLVPEALSLTPVSDIEQCESATLVSTNKVNPHGSSTSLPPISSSSSASEMPSISPRTALTSPLRPSKHFDACSTEILGGDYVPDDTTEMLLDDSTIPHTDAIQLIEDPIIGSVQPAHVLEVTRTLCNVVLTPPKSPAADRVGAPTSPADRKFLALDLAFSSKHSKDAESYFEYSIFEKTWSNGHSEGDVSASESIRFAFIDRDKANAQAELEFQKVRKLYENHSRVEMVSRPDEQGCAVFLGTFSPFHYPSKKEYHKVWVRRDCVSRYANQTPQNLNKTSLLGRTFYALRIFKLKPGSETSDGGDSNDITAPLRVYHPIERAMVYADLRDANTAAHDLQVELGHGKESKNEFHRAWQEEAKALSTRLDALNVAKEGEEKLWKSEFNGIGQELGSKFELMVEPMPMVGPRN